MSSAPNHGASNVPETGLSRNSSPVLSLTGQARKIFGHVRIENLVAGLSGGVVSTLVLHPLDLVKIRFAGLLILILNQLEVKVLPILPFPQAQIE